LRPLFGKRVVVTRAREQASKLVTMLTDLGARAIEVPTIRIEPPADSGALDRAAQQLAVGEYAAVVFTSANAVDPLLTRLTDLRVLSGCTVAAVGPATAEAIARHRVGVDVTPSRNLAEGLLDVFPGPPGPGARVLFPRSAEGRDVLFDGLAAAGWSVDLVEAYRTVRSPVPDRLLADVRSADAACFTSSSTVSGFVEACGLDAVPPVVVCIGPVTARTAADLGLSVDAVAASHDLPGLVDALVATLAPGGPSVSDG
jgi:uroporphyrinogen III methyltransferase/synthase